MTFNFYFYGILNVPFLYFSFCISLNYSQQNASRKKALLCQHCRNAADTIARLKIDKIVTKMEIFYNVES